MNFVAHLGALLSLYALMQVFCAPVLGRLSDVYGRRRILLFSLAGAAVDYAVMAAAPILWVLYAGRMIAGVTGATGAVAASTIADVTQPYRRAKWFGYMGACYGAGMIGGPMLGGLLGGLGVHAPFWGAAILNALGFSLAYAVLQKPKRPQAHSPLRAAFQIRVGFRPEEALCKSAALLLVFFLIQLIGQIPGALWVLHGESQFPLEHARRGRVAGGVWRCAHVFLGLRHRPSYASLWGTEDACVQHDGGWCGLRAHGLGDADLDGPSRHNAVGRRPETASGTSRFEWKYLEITAACCRFSAAETN